jgi:L-lactate dehydrogenase
MGPEMTEASVERAGIGHTKVGVVDVGAVGAATTLALIERGVCRELILIDKNAARARGVALNMGYGAPLSPAVDVHVGDYDALVGAQPVILTAGVNEKTGGPPIAPIPKALIIQLNSETR